MYNNLKSASTFRLNVRAFLVSITFCILLSLAAKVNAQIATGSLTGTVKDASGAVVRGAAITLTNDSTGVVARTRSTSTGTYVFEAVNPGTYTLQGENTGFKTFVSSGVIVHIQVVDTIDIPLQTGAITERVTVTAGAPLLQSEDASLGQTIDGKTINDMPLSTRMWTSLAQLAPGVAPTNGGTTQSDFYSVNGLNYFQNDFRLNGIDDNVEVYGGPNSNASIIPPPDAIEEFRLQTGNFSAEFGHSAGGVVNAVVKSGSNHVHGNLYEYNRNEAFSANEYFVKKNGGPRAKYRQNQYGGTIGGPVVIPKLYDGRNKTFFFGSYQGTKISYGNPSTSTVPTDSMVSSGFTNLQDIITTNSGTRTDSLNRIFPIGTVFDPSTTRTVADNAIDPVSGLQNTSGGPISVRDPFFTNNNGSANASVAGITDFTTQISHLNYLPGSRFDPNAVKILQLYPKGNAPGAANLYQNNYFQNPNLTSTQNQYDFRLDQNIGSKDILFGVFDLSRHDTLVPNTLPGLADGQNYGTGPNYENQYAISVGYTHIFSPTLTNEFHFGLIHYSGGFTPPTGATAGIPAMFGIQGIPQFPGNGGLPPINIGGLSGIGVSNYSPTIGLIKTKEYNDNVTKVHGSQTWKAGFQLDSIEGDITQAPAGKGTFSYSGQYSDIPNNGSGATGIADLLLVPSASTVNGGNNVGGLTQFQGSNYAATNDHRYYMGAYFQDDWKITSNLTLNLGVRWDRTTPYSETSGRQANFIANNGGNGPGGTYYLPNKTCANPRSPGFDALLQQDGITLKCIDGLDLGKAQYSNFAPRVGFAERITPTFVVRGGYGIAYGALDNIGYGGTIGNNYPFEYSVAQYSPNSSDPLVLSNGQTATLENAFAQTSLTDPSKVDGSGISLRGRQFNFQTPYTQTFNLTLQRMLGKYDSIQAGYVGTRSRHLDIQGYNNVPTKLAAPGANQYDYIPFPDFSPGSAYETTNGSSNYNSLQVVYSRSVAHGLSANVNYTYSKCMSNAAEFGRNFGYRAEFLPGFGIAGDNQICDADVTYLIHASGTYELPFGKGRLYLGGANWAVNAIAGGWTFNSIVTHTSGQPFTVYCPQQTNAFFGCYANRVQGINPYSGPHNADQWLNPAAFSNPPAYQPGNGFASLGGSAQQVRGPSLNNWDASIFKEFPIVDQVYVQFRAESFNVSNTPQFSNPSNLDFTNATNFSQITSERGGINVPRKFQFALKLFF